MQQKHNQAAQAGVGILSFVAAMTIKELSNFQFWSLVALGGALVAYAVFGFIFSREGSSKTILLPMFKLHPYRENLFPFRQALLIKDAAKIAYDCTHSTGLGINAMRWAVDQPTGDELSTYAHYFKDLGGYTLYGKRPSSNVYRIVPTSQLSSLWFTDDLNGLKHLGGMDTIQYVDVAVTRSDLRKLIREAKKIDRGTVQAQKVVKSNATKDTKIAQSVSQETIDLVTDKKPAVRDTKMSEALGYIEGGKWGVRWYAFIASPDNKQPKGHSPTLLRQAALDGEVRVWGKISEYGPYSLIPADYWKIWHIEWYSSLEGACNTEIAESGYTSDYKYYDLMVSKAEIEKKWSSKE